MKREFLKGFELSDEVINEIMSENGKDINAGKKDFEILENQVKDLTMQLDDAKKGHEQELARLERDAETKEYLSELKFINSETREYYAGKLGAALEDAKNAGKSRKELLEKMTNGEDGKPRTGVFESETPPPQGNPNKVIIPPTGSAATAEQNPFSAVIARYQKN